jgi:pyruvate dehydrogenase E1 component alpha subunit
MADPETYRDKEEVDKRRSDDPILRFSQQLLDAGIVQQSDLDAINEEVEKVVEQSIEFADNSPVPDPNTIFDHIYANGIRDSGSGAGKHGT